jgi:hypothetical protein
MRKQEQVIACGVAGPSISASGKQDQSTPTSGQGTERKNRRFGGTPIVGFPGQVEAGVAAEKLRALAATTHTPVPPRQSGLSPPPV